MALVCSDVLRCLRFHVAYLSVVPGNGDLTYCFPQAGRLSDHFCHGGAIRAISKDAHPDSSR